VPAPFRLNPELDVESLARTYREEGRVRIFGLLAEGAVELWEDFEARPDWIHLISTEEGPLELDPDSKAALGEDGWAAIAAKALEQNRDGHFQYRYLGVRVPADGEPVEDDDLIGTFAELMRSDPMLNLLEAVTGHPGLAFTDGQATAYDVGDFLTGHDDAVHGKERLAAFVFGLTPRWRLEWGGLLLFHGPMDRSVSGMVPRFNTLDLFSVPQQHSVSEVSAAAPRRRYALTGWLRGSGAAG
jgi:hypothetical protein